MEKTKKKVILWISIGVAVLLLIAAAILLFFMLKPSSGEKNPLDTTLSALISGKSEKVATLSSEGKPLVGVKNEGISLTVLSKITYEIETYEETNDTITATVTFTTPKMDLLVEQVLEEMGEYNETQFISNLTAKVKNNEEMQEFTVEVGMKKAENTWCLIKSRALTNALSGGLSEKQIELQQQLLNQMKGGE